MDEEKTSKLVKETETTLGATTIESVKVAEQAGEEAKVVSGIDRAKDTLERLKKWEEPGVDELKITKTGETVNGASKGGSSSKIDYDLVKDYVRDVESRTGIKLSKNQIEELKNALRNKEYTKLTAKETAKHRNEFNKIKN